MARNQVPEYWSTACDHLMQRDRILRRLIPEYANEALCLGHTPFQALARIVVGQQSSLATGRRLWTRLGQACMHPVQPQRIQDLGVEGLRTLGFSARKTQYLLDAARFFAQPGHMEPAWWQAQDNADVLQRLSGIRGVGRWTADMFLIFFLGRPDVLPAEDATLIKAISQHYFSGEPVSRYEAREVSQSWVPWRTVASWYLWRSLDAAAVDY